MKMADELPSEYDAIVIGTGVPESILAAALARIGQGVLHIDRNDYYGSDWSTFNFDSLERWIEKNKNPENETQDESESTIDTNNFEVGEGEYLIHMPRNGNSIQNLEVYSCIKEKKERTHSEDDILQKCDERGLHQVEEEIGLTTMAETSDDVEGRESIPDREENEAASHGKDGNDQGGNEEITEKDNSKECECKVLSDVQDPEKSEGADRRDVEVSDRVGSDVSGVGQGSDVSSKVSNAMPTTPSAGDEFKGLGIKAHRKEWTMEDIKKDWRRFNIDLAPKVLFSRGSLVELLISSNISRYAEFKCVTRILTHLNGKIEQVPCSRSDVFSSKYVSMLEKRMLMKFIEFCLSYEKHKQEYQEFEDKPFVEFLKTRKLTANLQHFVQHSIAMVTDQTPTLEGLKATHHFLHSLGRYGNTPFLWPLYGSGELPQCFCRMCAVFAGIYVLRRDGQALIIDEQSKLCKGIIDSEGQRLNCRWIIMEGSYVPHQHSKPELMGCVSRGIFFTDRSLKPGTEDQVTLLTIPPVDGRNPITLIELNHCAYACPKGMYVVHMTCRGTETTTAKDDLQYAVNLLFHPSEEKCEGAEAATPTGEVEKPKVLWCTYFNQTDTSLCVDEAFTGLPENVLVTSGPGSSIGFEHAVVQAKNLFEKICPGEEFLPAAPNPEDIIYVEDEAEKKEVGFENAGEVGTPDSEEAKSEGSSKVEGDDTEVKDEVKDTEEDSAGSKAGEEVKGESSKVECAATPEGKEVKGDTCVSEVEETGSKVISEEPLAESEEMKVDSSKVA
ncbi:rab proteins geranylgeranyltransferase component A 2-like [Ptychodera flava]|uniref:rab proteins geranylgeranyltransferase component A 2-like n=1 Tax=Ptychodera flava TaxID=63121 RepID=UPI003969D32A